MGSHRQGRLLILTVCALGALALSGCKGKHVDKGPDKVTEAPEAGSGTGSGSEVANPHGGDPHGGAPMGGGGGATPPIQDDGKSVVGPLALKIPTTWTARPTSSGMRAAEWEIPGAGGGDAAELVVYYFGQGGAGGVEENITRWFGQFEGDAGKPPVQKRSNATVAGGLKATLVEVEGRYVAAMTPGATEKQDKPGTIMLGAIVETDRGPYYFKLLGPKATVNAIRKEFAQTVVDISMADPVIR